MPQSTVEHTNPISVKTPVVVRDNYVMYLEWFNSQLWYHTDIFRWSSDIKKKFIEDLNTLQSLLPLSLVALVDESNNKLIKFCKNTGWKKGREVMLNNGSKANIFYWGK